MRIFFRKSRRICLEYSSICLRQLSRVFVFLTFPKSKPEVCTLLISHWITPAALNMKYDAALFSRISTSYQLRPRQKISAYRQLDYQYFTNHMLASASKVASISVISDRSSIVQRIFRRASIFPKTGFQVASH